MSDKLSRKKVKHVAQLSELNNSKAEEEKYSRQLSEVIDYVGSLSEVDTTKVDPTNNTTGLQNISRKDIIDKSHCFTQRESLSQTKRESNAYFEVEAIFEEKDE